VSAFEPLRPPHFPLQTQTLITEQGGGHLFYFDGLIPLPIGTRINLDNLEGESRVPIDHERFPSGHADAIALNAFVWGTQSSNSCLVLEVELTEPGDIGTWMVYR